MRQDNPEKEAQQHPFQDYFLNRKHSTAPANTNKLARLKSNYFGLMSEVDSNLGRLFTDLKSSSDWDNTLIVFTSDHGEQLGDHWLLGKMGYFDQSYYILLIIRDPDSRADISRNSHCEEFTENINIMPTMLAWLGLEIPAQCDDRSLLALLHHKEKQPDWRKRAHWEFDFRDVTGGEALEQHLGLNLHQCSLNVIRDKHYKYVHFTNLPPLFFDLQQDPEEFTNLAQDSDYAHLVHQYSQKMLSWHMRHDEQTLTHMKLTEEGVITRSAMRYQNK
ncbi:MAG: sulfatase-like hydrolase/transferase [Pseudomonadales bacterium]|nr:sulfatase-like hydrolase/transferase [Pseudomonadales bacterium]